MRKDQPEITRRSLSDGADLVPEANSLPARAKKQTRRDLRVNPAPASQTMTRYSLFLPFLTEFPHIFNRLVPHLLVPPLEPLTILDAQHDIVLRQPVQELLAVDLG